MLRSVFKELLWVLVSIVATILIAYFLLNWSFGNSAIDIHLHDTYLVIAPQLILLPIFLFLTLLLFFIKELPKKFSRKIPRIFMIVAGFGFLIITLYLIIAILGIF
jgi:hypothetical protein